MSGIHPVGQHTPTPEALAFAQGSVDEARRTSRQSPSVAPTPALPRKSGRGSERTPLMVGNDRFHGIDPLVPACLPVRYLTSKPAVDSFLPTAFSGRVTRCR